jgi:hypothetical protein
MAAGGESFDPSSATVSGQDNAELRLLTVENTGGGNNGMAIYNDQAAPRLLRVTAGASGSAVSLGVYNGSSSPTMTDVTASASGGFSSYGVLNASSSHRR